MIYGNIYIIFGIFIIIFLLQIFSNNYRNYMKNNINSSDKNNKNENFKNFKKKNNNLNNLTKKVKNNSRIINIKDYNLSFVEPNYGFILFNNNIYIDTMNSINYTARHSSNKYDCVKKYMESLVSISKQEKLDVNSLLNLIVNKIKNTKLQNFILINIQTSKIAKGNKWLEFNMPHTHSNIIIFPQYWFDNIKNLSDSTLHNEGSTLIHELIHINQRYNYKPYEKIYEKWGFIKPNYIDNMDHIRLLNRHNPDGIDIMWVWIDKKTNKYYWIGTLFNDENPKNLSDVNYLAFELSKINNIHNEMNFKCFDNTVPLKLSQFTNFIEYFNISNNHYHPNEIIASYMEIFYKNSYFKNKKIIKGEAYKIFENNIDSILNN